MSTEGLVVGWLLIQIGEATFDALGRIRPAAASGRDRDTVTMA
jgi:hypothetical protein